MSLLAKVQHGRTPRPPRLLVSGTPGIGKSTFGSQTPKPLFVPTEDRLDEIDCAKFPLAASIDEVLAALAELRTQPHDFETVVLSSLDWLERLVRDHVCIVNVKNIEKSGSGNYLQLTFAIIEGEHKGRFLWARLNLDNPNPTAVAIAKAELSAICRAVGVLAPNDSTELHDLPLVIHVKRKKREDTGEIGNEVGEALSDAVL